MGRLLSQAGFRMQFVAARRLAAARRAARFIGAGRAVSLHAPELKRAQVFLLTTSDSAIEAVARQLAASVKDLRGKIALHACGSLPASVLAPLKRRGAAVGSLHPYQTIPNPKQGTRNLRGCFWGIEGDAKANRVAKRWIRALGGIAFPVREENKTLYHLSAFLTCPTIVTLMNASTKLLAKSGVPERIAQPMLAGFVATTAKNFGIFGAKKSLTGPAARGDWETLRKHLRALRRDAPEIVPAYKEILRLMLRLAGKKPPRDLR